MDFSHLTLEQWLLAILAALMVGISKSGFGGVGMLTVVLMAMVMRGHERESTGVVLPMLIFGDLFAVHAFKRHVQWRFLGRMLPAAAFGVFLGYFWIKGISNSGFKPVVGWVVLCLIGLQICRQFRPLAFQDLPYSRWFAWTMGIGAGMTTMLANAAGPVMTLYFLAVKLPKLEFVATTAWFFLVVNLWKVPFSTSLGLIHGGSLRFNAVLVPFVGVGIVTGRFLVHRINQQLFERLLLILTALTGLHLILF